jgi:hypothetical protein
VRGVLQQMPGVGELAQPLIVSRCWKVSNMFS